MGDQHPMFGNDRFAFYMQRNGSGRINFDLTLIKVKATAKICPTTCKLAGAEIHKAVDFSSLNVILNRKEENVSDVFFCNF